MDDICFSLNIGISLVLSFTPFQDGVPYSGVTTQFAERCFLLNPICIRNTVHLFKYLIACSSKLIRSRTKCSFACLSVYLHISLVVNEQEWAFVDA